MLFCSPSRQETTTVADDDGLLSFFELNTRVTVDVCNAVESINAPSQKNCRWVHEDEKRSFFKSCGVTTGRKRNTKDDTDLNSASDSMDFAHVASVARTHANRAMESFTNAILDLPGRHH